MSLDPAVRRVLEQVRSNSNMSVLHPNDIERWVSVFPALLEAGYDYHEDDINEWLGILPKFGDPDPTHTDIYAWRQRRRSWPHAARSATTTPSATSARWLAIADAAGQSPGREWSERPISVADVRCFTCTLGSVTSTRMCVPAT